MIIAIHQPNYLPYLGFFFKMEQSDLFVIYDNAQFNKGDYHHRNKIRIFHEWKWLTVPVEKKNIPINEIIVRNDLLKTKKWQDIHFNEIYRNYKDTPYFHIYENEFKDIYNKDYRLLVDLNMSLIDCINNAFDITTKYIFSSELSFNSKSTQRLVDIVEALGGDTYLSGPSGRKYLDISLFNNKGIEVIFQDFIHPTYKQHYKGFISNMSAIDVLFNAGKMKIGEQIGR